MIIESPGDQINDYIDSITDIVMESFKKRPMPFGDITAQACKERVEYCEELFLHFYKAANYSIVRVLDNLPRWLIARLDGVTISRIESEEVREDNEFQKIDNEIQSTIWSGDSSKNIEPEKRLSALSVQSNKTNQLPMIIVKN